MLIPIILNKKISSDTFIASLDYRSLPATNIIPGQFYMMGIPGHCELVLRRPFSVCDFDGKTLKIAYKVVGKGTSVLSTLKKGSTVDLLGPFGNGFQYDRAEEKAIFVAGGIGIAPFLYFAKKLLKESKGRKSLTLLYGGRTVTDLSFKKYFNKLTDETIISTEDGSEGDKGFVTDVLEKKLKILLKNKKSDVKMYASGPRAMLKKIDGISRQHMIPCQLSAETIMGCGYGICLGCVLEKNKNRQKKEKKHTLVCKDGPVFQSGEIDW